jgi:hypothetical protein
MKKILIPTLLILIISCQKNNSNKTPARSYTDSIMELTRKISKTDTITLTEKEKYNDQIARFKSESKLKNLSQKNFDFIINKLLESGYSLDNYTYIDYDKINNGDLETELNSGPVDKTDERVKNKNFFVFEFNYGTHSSLSEEYFLLQNDEMIFIDFKLNETDNKKLNLLLEKVGGEKCHLSTRYVYEIHKDKQNNYDLTFGLQKESDPTGVTCSEIKYKTKDFKSIVSNSIMKFDVKKNKFVELN